MNLRLPMTSAILGAAIVATTLQLQNHKNLPSPEMALHMSAVHAPAVEHWKAVLPAKEQASRTIAGISHNGASDTHNDDTSTHNDSTTTHWEETDTHDRDSVIHTVLTSTHKPTTKYHLYTTKNGEFEPVPKNGGAVGN